MYERYRILSMTIQNKEWFVTQIARMSLEGLSQEEIAHKLGISEGSVNAAMQELVKSDNTLTLQHEIAVLCSKKCISIKQLAFNLSFSNAIKRKGFDENKIDNILEALNASFVGDRTHAPESAAELVLQICNLAVKNNMNIDSLYGEIEYKIYRLARLNRRIDSGRKRHEQIEIETQRALDENNLTLSKLNELLIIKEAFEEVGLDFENKNETINVLNNLRLIDNNPDEIIVQLKKVNSLKVQEMDLTMACSEKRKILETYERNAEQQLQYWTIYYQSLNEFIKLKQLGIPWDSMLQIFETIRRHWQYVPMNELVKDIDSYGGIKGALFKAQQELDEFLTAKQNLFPNKQQIPVQ